MPAMTSLTEAIGRSLSDIALEPAATPARRAEVLSRIRASCEFHIRMLAIEAEHLARGDLFAAGGSTPEKPDELR